MLRGYCAWEYTLVNGISPYLTNNYYYFSVTKPVARDGSMADAEQRDLEMRIAEIINMQIYDAATDRCYFGDINVHSARVEALAQCQAGMCHGTKYS